MVGMVLSRSRTRARVFAPNWAALEARFPEIRDMATYAQKWAYVEEQSRYSIDQARFIKSNRPEIRGSRRDSNKRR